MAAYKQSAPPLHPPPPPPVVIEIVHTDVPHEEPQETVSPPPVYFATENSTVVTAQTGSTALVPCVVKNIGDGVVSMLLRSEPFLTFSIRNAPPKMSKLARKNNAARLRRWATRRQTAEAFRSR